ncbi:MAG: DUF1614 domain-containing protein [Candidatus Binatia bacterium]
MRSTVPPGCLPLVIFFGLALLLPFFFANLMLEALGKLGLSPRTSFLAALGIFLGGMVNIPVKQIEREERIELTPFALFGVGSLFPRFQRQRTSTIIAVNVGGCIVPTALAVYELSRVAGVGPNALMAAAVATAINIVVCYRLARPVPRVGIALPALMPALVAAACALLFVPDMAPSIAFAAGVFGPLVGADLLHLRDIENISAGVASIGGAGTFDGIVLSALVATLLA